MGPRLSAAENVVDGAGKAGREGDRERTVNASARRARCDPDCARGGTGTSLVSFQLAPRKKKTRDPRGEEGEAINADK